jgi:putative acetyltransferase
MILSLLFASKKSLSAAGGSMATQTDKFTVRAFRMDDWRDVAEVWQQPEVIWGTLQLPYQSLDDLRQRLENPPEGLRRLVAETSEGRVIGMLGLQVGHGRRLHSGHIGMMVHPDLHNRGVGSALLEAAIELAGKWLNLTRLDLQVYTDNAPAIHLYEKYGFEIEGTLRRYAFRDGEYVDSYQMARVGQ